MNNAFDVYERQRWTGRADAYGRSFAHLCAYPAGATAQRRRGPRRAAGVAGPATC